jgi:hypothetical protein
MWIYFCLLSLEKEEKLFSITKFGREIRQMMMGARWGQVGGGSGKRNPFGKLPTQIHLCDFKSVLGEIKFNYKIFASAEKGILLSNRV